MTLFGDDAKSANQLLSERHYLGPSLRGSVYRDEYGVMVFANPSSRRLPHGRWIELVRWCIVGAVKNAGSRQWRAARRWLLATYPAATTVVSYSDPSVGHTGALYRACNWLWAPTWHRLREPPSGNGAWTDGKKQAVKDRWVFPLRPDADRVELLRVKDESLRAAMPWAEYREGIGGDYRRWRRSVDDLVRLDSPIVAPVDDVVSVGVVGVEGDGVAGVSGAAECGDTRVVGGLLGTVNAVDVAVGFVAGVAGVCLAKEDPDNHAAEPITPGATS